MSAEVKVLPKSDAIALKCEREIKRLKKDHNEVLIKVMARGYLAPLNLLIESELDRDVALQIYSDIMLTASRMSKKFNFSLTKK